MNLGKNHVTETSKNGTQQHRGDKGTSSSSTLQYVVVVPLVADTVVTKKGSEIVATQQDISPNTFSFALQNVTDEIPQGEMPRPVIPVMDLVTDKEHDDVHTFEKERIDVEVPKGPVNSSLRVYNVEHVDVHEEVIVSLVRVIPTDIQSTAAPTVSVSTDTVVDLATAQLPVQRVPHEGAAATTITAVIQPTVTNS